MSTGIDLVDVELGSIPMSTADLAKIDAAAYSRGATREAVIRQFVRAGISTGIREVTR